jgi:hypothetical protein
MSFFDRALDPFGLALICGLFRHPSRPKIDTYFFGMCNFLKHETASGRAGNRLARRTTSRLGPNRRAASIRADQDPFAANEHNLRPASHRRWRNRSGGHPFEPTLSIDCSN